MQKNNSEVYLSWNLVPFSKYPSWCTSRMSPYFDFRWQRKGLYRTSTFTSGSGSFPPQAAASREEQNQPSTASSIFSSLAIYLKQERPLERPLRTHRQPSTVRGRFHHAGRRKSTADWLFRLVSPAPKETTTSWLRFTALEASLQGFLTCPRNVVLTRHTVIT